MGGNPINRIDPYGLTPIVVPRVIPLPPRFLIPPRPITIPTPRPIPIPIDPVIPIPNTGTQMCPADENTDGCSEEIQQCTILCTKAQNDLDMKGIWGGSWAQCMLGCVSWRCMDQL